jgi:predicted acetyltransferase
MARSPLTFRPATVDDVDALAELSYHSFPAVSRPVDVRRQWLLDHENVRLESFLVGESAGHVVTAMNGIAFTTWIGGAPQPMLGVASVVVAPEMRRYGYASDLVTQGMRRARESGVALSALYPFRHKFYASLGYGLAVEHREWSVQPDDLPCYVERERARRAGPDDAEAIGASYERVMRRSTLMVERSASDWALRHFAQGARHAVVYEDAGGVVRGYFLYQYREHPDGRLTDLFVNEIVYEDQEALRGLLGYVAALRDQFQTATLVVRSRERLELRLSNPRDGGAAMGSISKMYGPRVLYGAMVRVLDVERAVRARGGYDGATGHVQLSIVDEQFPENEGPWTLVFEGGRAEVEAKAPASSLTAGGASMGIGTFSQLYAGYLTAAEARAIGLVSADDAAVDLLDRAFAGPEPSLLDHF